MARPLGHGKVRQGKMRLGMARPSWFGKIRLGMARQGKVIVNGVTEWKNLT